jgi:hypothetical protein
MRKRIFVEVASSKDPGATIAEPKKNTGRSASIIR